MRRLGIFLSCGALFVVVLGCNSLLENEPGRLDRGASAGRTGDESEPEPIRGGGEPGANGTSGGADPTGTDGSNDTSGGVGGEGLAPDAGTGCGAGLKACGEACVSVDDPLFGCASPQCSPCVVPNATAACVMGACAIGTCAAGSADCNATLADGCEASLATVNACGGCGLQCPTLENADMACVGGVCTGTCSPGFGDCNGKPEDGCEKNLLKDRNHCGACGTRCLFGRCEQGVCAW
jgi:hypothetical protein